jgi:hypothetical protein
MENLSEPRTDIAGAPVQCVVTRRFLIAEYCDADFYMGWHFYLRESKLKNQPNQDGWGWVRRPGNVLSPIRDLLAELGIVISGDGTLDSDGIAEFARRYPMRSKVGGKNRGCLEVEIDDYGHARMLTSG